MTCLHLNRSPYYYILTFTPTCILRREVGLDFHIILLFAHYFRLCLCIWSFDFLCITLKTWTFFIRVQHVNLDIWVLVSYKYSFDLSTEIVRKNVLLAVTKYKTLGFMGNDLAQLTQHKSFMGHTLLRN